MIKTFSYLAHYSFIRIKDLKILKNASQQSRWFLSWVFIHARRRGTLVSLKQVCVLPKREKTTGAKGAIAVSNVAAQWVKMFVIIWPPEMAKRLTENCLFFNSLSCIHETRKLNGQVSQAVVPKVGGTPSRRYRALSNECHFQYFLFLCQMRQIALWLYFFLTYNCSFLFITVFGYVWQQLWTRDV